MEQDRPRLDAAARRAIEEALVRGVDVIVRRSAEGGVIVEQKYQKIIYRTP